MILLFSSFTAQPAIFPTKSRLNFAAYFFSRGILLKNLFVIVQLHFFLFSSADFSLANVQHCNSTFCPQFDTVQN